MKNTIIILMTLLSISLLKAEEYHFNYHFDTPEFSKGQVTIDGCNSVSVPLMPRLPRKQVSIALPPGANVTNINISKIEINSIVGPEPVMYAMPGGDYSKETQHSFNPNQYMFSGDMFYPDQENISYHIQYKHGVPVLLTTLNPLAYNPARNEMRFASDISLSLKINATKTSYKLTRRQYIDLKKTTDISMIEDKIELLNFQDEAYEYLIITKQDYVAQFDRFIEFNSRRAMRSKVVAVEYIAENSEGDDMQERIRNYIRSEYEQHDVEYVLLAGNDSVVPPRLFYAALYDNGTDYVESDDIPADMYYACLDGNWKNDGDEVFAKPGSEDLLWDVAVGRWPVNYPYQLENIISKTILYSESPATEAVKSCLMAGGFLWGPSSSKSDYIETWGGTYLDELIGQVSANGHNTSGIPEDWYIAKLYERDADEKWNEADLFREINTNKIHIINHLSHSATDYAVKVRPVVANSRNMKNDGINSNFFIVYSQGCSAGGFDGPWIEDVRTDECIGGRFVTTEHGAVAFLGNSRAGFGSPYDTDGATQLLHRYWLDALFGNNIHGLADMATWAKEQNAHFILETDLHQAPYYGQLRWCAYTLNLLGDPALSVWSDTPAEISPVYSDIWISPYLVSAAPGARVALANAEGRIMFTGICNQDGAIHCKSELLTDYIEDTESGTLKLYIKADNYLNFAADVVYNVSGISDEKPRNEIIVSPQPARATVNIELPAELSSECNIKFYDINARLVDEQDIKDNMIQWTAPGSGIYIMQCSGGSKIISEKIIID